MFIIHTERILIVNAISVGRTHFKRQRPYSQAIKNIYIITRRSYHIRSFFSLSVCVLVLISSMSFLFEKSRCLRLHIRTYVIHLQLENNMHDGRLCNMCIKYRAIFVLLNFFFVRSLHHSYLPLCSKS